MFHLYDLPARTEAIRYACRRLGYKTIEVDERMDAIDRWFTHHLSAAEIRNRLIDMRGYDMPTHVDTFTWLDPHLEELIDLLASDEDRAELYALASR